MTAVAKREPFESRDVSEFDEPEWEPLPVAQAAAATSPAEPEHGRGLVYGGGAVTVVSSEPGVGKSMMLAAFTVDAALDDHTVLYLDFERTAELLLERLGAAGLRNEELARVRYLRPSSPASPEGIRRMIEWLAPSLVVLDSYDAALALFGLEPTNEDLRRFAASVLDPLRSGGAAVVPADHVTKDRERRGPYSIGGQAKLALAEAHLGLTTIIPLRRGAEGKLKVRVHKDTYGRLPATAVFTLRSNETTGALSWDVTAGGGDERDDEHGFRPTGLMERVSRSLEIVGKPVSRAELERDVQGKRDYIRQAIDVLVREEYAEEEPGPRGARLVKLLRPFREDAE